MHRPSPTKGGCLEGPRSIKNSQWNLGRLPTSSTYWVSPTMGVDQLNEWLMSGTHAHSPASG
jgi:hypothetical protein